MDKLVHNATIDGDDWQPLINYRRILNDEPGGGHGSKARLSTATRGRKRAAPQDGKSIAFFPFSSNLLFFLLQMILDYKSTIVLLNLYSMSISMCLCYYCID